MAAKIPRMTNIRTKYLDIETKMAAKVVRISKSGLTLNRPFNNPIRPDIES
jgi:hypothetical protein